MDAISKAISEVRFEIPTEILEHTFRDPRFSGRGFLVSTDTRIREEVIYERVVVDCNLFGAQQTAVPLTGLCPEFPDPYSAIFRIPPQVIQGRSITSVLSVCQGTGQMGHGGTGIPQQGSALGHALQQLLDSNLPVPVVSNAYVRLIGENTVFIEGVDVASPDLWLRCMLTHDSTLSNIPPASYHAFAQLVVLATKAHVFRMNQIRMDVGQLHGGMQLGTFKEIIDGYSDANELYKVHLEEVWRKTAFMSDTTTWQRHLKTLTGGGR